MPLDNVGTLRVISGPRMGHSVEVDRELVIGREDADLSLTDDEASRRHAAVRPVPGGIAVRDLSSLNGTFVNGERIAQEVVLRVNGTLRVGATDLAVELPSDATVIRQRPVATPEVTVARPTVTAPPSPSAEPAPPPGAPSSAAPPPAAPPAAPPPRYGAPSGGRRSPGGGGTAPGGRAAFLRRPWVQILGLLLVAAAVAGVLAASSGSGKSHAARRLQAVGSTALVDVPVQFTVQDQDRSLLRCPTSGRTYVVQGRLVAPPAGPGSAATVYLHGVILSGQFEWHYDVVPGYDYARGLAKLGHTSVVIDRVAYGKTIPYPADGTHECLGAQADEVHQVIGQLRSGRYTVTGSSGVQPKAFSRIGLAGYSIGAVITELEAGSFGDENAIAIVSWADEGMTNYGTPFSEIPKLCFPGSPKVPGGQRGYFRTLPLVKLAPLLSGQADPRVVASLTRYAELDPCGQLLTGGRWFSGLDSVARARVKAPVLVINGIYDVLFHRYSWRQEFDHFTGTHDKKLIEVPAGQLVMLDRQSNAFRHDVASWLGLHGL